MRLVVLTIIIFVISQFNELTDCKSIYHFSAIECKTLIGHVLTRSILTPNLWNDELEYDYGDYFHYNNEFPKHIMGRIRGDITEVWHCSSGDDSPLVTVDLDNVGTYASSECINELPVKDSEGQIRYLSQNNVLKEFPMRCKEKNGLIKTKMAVFVTNEGVAIYFRNQRFQIVQDPKLS